MGGGEGVVVVVGGDYGVVIEYVGCDEVGGVVVGVVG